MYLKKIISSGFKSFADKLEISLDDKITCIVGPNGSGKSNVVDAVRWVLGEQSVKSLRGDGSMTDVIFSGSKSRNPLNVASVELIFDNNDHYVNIPYTEISIKRRVYRSGENEYYLNGEKCRLKDINNLLLDTGMGKESFNIISQGEVDKILSNSSSERRVIFEEASGILKYKKRKEEALRKLDRTHNNLDRVNDIINELENQIIPLKRQSKKALEYLENKKGLETYEVALLAYDINDYYQKCEILKEQLSKISNEIVLCSNTTSKFDALEEELQKQLLELEETKNKYQKELLLVTEEKEKLDGEKNLLKERSKQQNKEDEIVEKIRIIVSKKEKLTSDISVIDDEVSMCEKKLAEVSSNELDVLREIENIKLKRKMLMNDYSTHNREKLLIENRIRSLENQIDENIDMPNSVRKVIKNTSLNGIHNTLGNLLQTEDKYIKALNISIASSKNFIITKDENSAKIAIKYLKDNNLGRATFFPLDVINERTIDYNTLNILKSSPDFIGVMSDLVIYNSEYSSVVKNQLGIVIVTEDIDSATRLSHLINAKYKIVTLDGDVIHIGGSLSGGSAVNFKSGIILKQEKSHLEEKYKLLTEEEKEISKELVDLDSEDNKISEKLFAISKEKVEIEEKIKQKLEEKNSINNSLQSIISEYNSLEAIKNNSLLAKEEQIIKLFHEKSSEKTKLENEIKIIIKKEETLKLEIEEKSAEEKLNNQKLRQLEKDKEALNIEINRYDVKLDNMLELLSNEYELTYEKAKKDYVLDIEAEEAREKVNTYRSNIKRIGMVNLEAIEEYEQVNSRYEFLTKQKEDLENASNTLLEIMNEMDSVMKEEFKNTFEKVREEFKKVFKELFKGGNADLTLTDPKDLLTTGVEIAASPPGKKLTTISLLSGGEKTLTAISLLFAILNVREVPFCLFDEVEAALDEANVSGFGKYLDNYKEKTQFLIITHKKKTMEYANTLYGITMQESGVSKLVSVKLEQKIKD